MFYIGIDIGSTAAKVAIFHDDNIIDTFTLPTGWSSLETAKSIEKILEERNICKENRKVIATGYGRVSVPYADKSLTEITCHGKGAAYIYENNCTVIDIGGQDTKVITVENGQITNFTMNDKCSAGTGRFMEIMANTLGVDINELCDLATNGKDATISSMCTVFAESEVISLIGSGRKKSDIAFAIVDSIISKVSTICGKHSISQNYFLTGGLCNCKYIIDSLSEKLGAPVKSKDNARFAGAIGAGLLAMKLK
ncbi:MAG: acyl-CoA dehydratase activase [Clostridium sp.]|uniref:acyl-CoA dehydratase activase n=1 Tax=Clostridium sp. TaxID=1506 RepID=UPI0030616BF6